MSLNVLLQQQQKKETYRKLLRNKLNMCENLTFRFNFERDLFKRNYNINANFILLLRKNQIKSKRNN